MNVRKTLTLHYGRHINVLWTFNLGRVYTGICFVTRRKFSRELVFARLIFGKFDVYWQIRKDFVSVNFFFNFSVHENKLIQSFCWVYYLAWNSTVR